MWRFLVVSSMVVTLATAGAMGCTSTADPFAGEGDGGTPAADAAAATDAITAPPEDGGAPGLRCPPKPARMVVLGDSITACSVVGGPSSANCVSKQVFDYVKATYATGVVYLNVAVGASQTAGIAQQLQRVPGGPGHVLVLIYTGGNDLSPYIFQTDAAAEEAYGKILPAIVQNWKDIYAFFENKTRFPDGVTVIMNNQYNPFDDCTAGPFNVTQKKFQLLHMYNVELRSISAGKAESSIIIDQYTPFLGHGHHYNVTTCPHYKPGMKGYMQDLIHADGPGNAHLAAQIFKGVDQLYKGCP